MKTEFRRILVPLVTFCTLLAAGLARPLQAADSFPSSATGPSIPGLTEARLQAALPGKTLVRLPTGEFQRFVSSHSSQGRLITGPALTALFAQGTTPCRQADFEQRMRCLDSLDRDTTGSPKALREIEAAQARDTVGAGLDREGPESRNLAAELTQDEVQKERNRGYAGQFLADIGGGGNWDLDADDWAAVLYVVVGVVVVGAFVLGGGKAIYDLAVNKDEEPVFKELGLRFSYSGLAMHDAQGGSFYRDAYLAGLRFAFGVEKPIMSLGLALEGGSINLTVSGLGRPGESLDFRGGYLVGGPMVRFGNYHPLALTLEFLNGTSTHESIGWISKSRLALATRTGPGLLLGAHVGAVFYDLRFSDGLVFRRGDLNRDLSLLAGLDAGWEF